MSVQSGRIPFKPNSFYMHKPIILNPEEALRLEYEYKWKSLISFESFLSVKAQQAVYDMNAKGYERTKTQH
jgi:hypothetical protein